MAKPVTSVFGGHTKAATIRRGTHDIVCVTLFAVIRHISLPGVCTFNQRRPVLARVGIGNTPPRYNHSMIAALVILNNSRVASSKVGSLKLDIMTLCANSEP